MSKSTANKPATKPATNKPVNTSTASLLAVANSAPPVASASTPAQNLWPKGAPRNTTATGTPLASFAAKVAGVSQTFNGATMLTRTGLKPRNGASALTQSAWVFINAMAAGSTATVEQCQGANPTQAYANKQQWIHVQYAISQGYLVPA